MCCDSLPAADQRPCSCRPEAYVFNYSDHFIMAQMKLKEAKDPTKVRARNNYFIALGNDALREHLRKLLNASPQNHKHADMPLSGNMFSLCARSSYACAGSHRIGRHRRQPGSLRRPKLQQLLTNPEPPLCQGSIQKSIANQAADVAPIDAIPAIALQSGSPDQHHLRTGPGALITLQTVYQPSTAMT